MENKILKLPFSIKMAILSFLMGTTLFIGYFVADDKLIFIILGFMFVIIALISNLFMLIILLFDWIENPNEKKQISRKVLILIANIPIAIIYLAIIMY
jgi:heme/copper-type cytochrome/quinol oxidase subunit 2